MISKITDFLWLTFAFLVVLSIGLCVKKDFEEIKTYQTYQAMALERITLMQDIDSKLLKKCSTEMKVREERDD